VLSLQSGLRPSLRLNTRTKQEPILSQTLVLKSGGGHGQFLEVSQAVAGQGVAGHGRVRAHLCII